MAGKSFLKLGQTGIGTQTTAERTAGVSTATGTTTFDTNNDVFETINLVGYTSTAAPTIVTGAYALGATGGNLTINANTLTALEAVTITGTQSATPMDIKTGAAGDTVTLGGVTGTVEKVGFRSTRIRTFDKSVVTVPNKNIISTELDNLGARPVRRVKFNIGLTYDTSVENIKNIVDDIQKLVDDHPMTNQEGKVRFLNFGASSLDIMVLYYVDSPDWEVLIDAQQKINFQIIDIVNKYKCEFAFPSTSVYIEKN